jgi:hypothetical protein
MTKLIAKFPTNRVVEPVLTAFPILSNVAADTIGKLLHFENRNLPPLPNWAGIVF